MKLENSKTKNLKMTPACYELRRQVMGYIYEAKQVVELPRISVRITEDHPEMLGCAWMKENVIFITKRAITSGEIWDLRAVVYHEIAHAVFGSQHDEKCPLMKAAATQREGLSREEAQEILKRLAVRK